MTEHGESFVWRTIIAFVSMLVAWTLILGPGSNAEAGFSSLERMEDHDECASVCDTEIHICCVSTESQMSRSP